MHIAVKIVFFIELLVTMLADISSFAQEQITFLSVQAPIFDFLYSVVMSAFRLAAVERTVLNGLACGNENIRLVLIFYDVIHQNITRLSRVVL